MARKDMPGQRWTTGMPFYRRKKNECKAIFHILYTIYRYSSEDAVGDLVAGITVGLTVIPQALAYAGIAGLPPAVIIILF